MNRYLITCYKDGAFHFDLKVEHMSPGEALEFAILQPSEHGKLKPDTRILNRGNLSYTVEDRHEYKP